MTLTGAPPSQAPRVRRRRRRRRSPARLIAALVGGVALLACGWLGLRAVQAAQHLSAAQSGLDGARAAALAGQGPEADRLLAVAQEQAKAARRAVADPVWAVSARLPFVGGPLRAARGACSVAADLTTEVAPPVVDAAALLARHLVTGPGSVDTGVLGSQAAALSAADVALGRQSDALTQLPSAALVPPLDRGLKRLSTAVATLHGEVHSAAVLAAIGPGMLGGDGDRNYFVVFQNNAEARATGGIIGAFGILHASRGAVSFTRLGSNIDLQQRLAPVVLPGTDQTDRYAGSGATSVWQNINVTADFPTAAGVYAKLWEEQTGQHVDGTIATDPVMLSYLLAASGPVTLGNGDRVDANNAVQLSLSSVYARFDDALARKDYLQQIARATTQGVLSAPASQGPAIVTALRRAAGEGRLLVWSERAPEQTRIATTVASGALPSAAAPVSMLRVNNTTGSKLDFYLETGLRFHATTCNGARRTTTADIVLHNTAPATGLPAYAVLRGGPDVPGPPGTSVYQLSYYATAGATLLSATVDGATATANLSVERHLAVVGMRVVVPAGQVLHIRLQLAEPVLPGPVAQPPQALVRPQSVASDAPVCSAAAAA